MVILMTRAALTETISKDTKVPKQESSSGPDKPKMGIVFQFSCFLVFTADS